MKYNIIKAFFVVVLILMIRAYSPMKVKNAASQNIWIFPKINQKKDLQTIKVPVL